MSKWIITAIVVGSVAVVGSVLGLLIWIGVNLGANSPDSPDTKTKDKSDIQMLTESVNNLVTNKETGVPAILAKAEANETAIKRIDRKLKQQNDAIVIVQGNVNDAYDQLSKDLEKQATATAAHMQGLQSQGPLMQLGGRQFRLMPGTSNQQANALAAFAAQFGFQLPQQGPEPLSPSDMMNIMVSEIQATEAALDKLNPSSSREMEEMRAMLQQLLDLQQKKEPEKKGRKRRNPPLQQLSVPPVSMIHSQHHPHPHFVPVPYRNGARDYGNGYIYPWGSAAKVEVPVNYPPFF